jgi:hypothetical protein
MKNTHSIFRLVALAIVMPVALTDAAPQVKFVDPSDPVETYDFAEITIHVTDPDIANPFTDASVQGTFERQDADPIKVDGFCDSPDGSVFRIRFMPQQPGRYNYQIQYRQEGVDVAHSGTFEAVASDRKGPLRVDPNNRWHFIWAGSAEHYFWNGTTTYYLMGWDDHTIRQSIDRLSRLQINRLRVLL